MLTYSVLPRWEKEGKNTGGKRRFMQVGSYQYLTSFLHAYEPVC